MSNTTVKEPVVFEASSCRGTPGKMILACMVTDLDGGQIGVGQALVRFLVKGFVSGWLFVGYIIACFHSQSQALHDMAAGTLVLKKS